MSLYNGRRVAVFVASVLALYGTECHLCGQDGADSADHVIPRSKGGPVWDLANARPAHKLCNIRRGAQDLAAWFAAHPLPVGTPRPLAPSRDW